MTLQEVPSASSPRYVLGVDGGGTKTAALLAAVDSAGGSELIGRGLAGASNPRAVGIEASRREISAAASAAWNQAGLSPRPAAIAVLAVAGTGRPDMAALVQKAALADDLAQSVKLVHDAEAVLAAGTPAGWGVALIAGTGSSAVAVSPGGERCVCGGWGYRFGDEGSGYWLGREALAVVAQAADGRHAPTGLTKRVLDQLDVNDPRQLLAALEATGDERSAIASLSPLVLAAAAEGDESAKSLCAQAADRLSELVLAAAERLGLPAGYPLALAGGVLVNSAAMREQVAVRVANAPAPSAPPIVVDEPAAGCIALALREL